MRLRAFFSSRPERSRLKRSGIVKERVFGCDLGEHLLNSGNDGKLSTKVLLFIVMFISPLSKTLTTHVSIK